MTPRRILLAGWLVFLLYAYPGYVTTEGADMVVDARVGTFTDWHSVMMTEVWRWVGHVIAGPPGMLFVQSLLLLLGSFHIARRIMAERAAAWLAVAILLVPPALATTALVSAETQLASWLVGGTAALMSERFRRRLLGLGMMVIACGMRTEAAYAALPLIAALFVWRSPQPRWRRVGIALAAWFVVMAAAWGLERALVDLRSEREQVRLAMVDIVGTVRYAPPLGDDKVLALLGDARVAGAQNLQAQTRELYGRELFYGAGDRRIFEPPETQEERDALYAARRAVIRALPGAYLRHRWHHMFRLFGIKTPSWTSVYTQFYERQSDEEGMRHAGRHSAIQGLLIAPVDVLSDTFLFRPVLYLALALVLLPLAIVRRQRVAIALLASGIAYAFALAVASTHVEYRESHWLIVATLLAAFLLAARRLGAGPPVPPPTETV